MKVFLTGATGFVGAHIAQALHQAGYELRLLVRNKAVAEAYFSTHGITINEYVTGDMLDTAVVKKAMQGCDAVIHAAAIVNIDASFAKNTIATNLRSIESVIGSACELGMPRIIYVSSMTALFTPNGQMLNEQAALSTLEDGYSKSKRLCEEKVRALQQQGYPIIITYPSSVIGPDDPKLSQSMEAVLKFLTLVMPISSSGIQFVDVRDLAQAHVLLLQKPLDENRCKERYLIAGHFYTWKDFAALLEQCSAVRLRKIPVPGAVFRASGRLFDFMRRFFSIAFPLSKESTVMFTQSPTFDSSWFLSQVDMTFRDAQDTLAATAEWLKKSGHIK